ncbi:MAG: monovalent cation:proton antiporter-2 (CPA2) family protein, partial [Spongiibacteraceae bacterium]
MPHEDSLLQAAVVFLLAAVIAVPLAKKLQLGAVLGYLVAGVVIGPSVLQLIQNPENVAHISELGVVLLLFIIGLELSPKRLWVMRRSVFGTGAAQVFITAFIIAGMSMTVFGQPFNVAVILGLGLALSSTAFGLQMLAEKKELASAHGRTAFSVLLFQDIVAIPLIALVPLLSGGESESSVGGADQAVRGLLSVAVVVLGGRYMLRPLFRIVAKTGLQEVSTATALLVVMGTAWFMELAGVSMALGAFLAGVLLAESEYRHELESQLEPFKGLLLGLFFMSVGMSADISLLVSVPLQVLLVVCLLLLIKFPVIFLIGKMLVSLDTKSAIQLAVVLAAGGEFAFVVFQIAHEQGLLDTQLHSLLVLAITLSMAVMPVLMLLIAAVIRRRQTEPMVPPEYADISADGAKVLIVGMGRMGQVVARMLRAQKIDFIALETGVEAIELSRSVADIPLFYGDPLRPEILRAVQAESAEYVVITTDDPDVNLRLVELLQRLYPGKPCVVRARSRSQVHELQALGATPVRETFHSSLE